MNREQMVGKVAVALVDLCWDEVSWVAVIDQARAVIDVVLPQITTAAELAALPKEAVVIDCWGAPWEREHGYWRTSGVDYPFTPQQVFDGGQEGLTGLRGPLTVVWQPEVQP